MWVMQRLILQSASVIILVSLLIMLLIVAMLRVMLVLSVVGLNIVDIYDFVVVSVWKRESLTSS